MPSVLDTLPAEAKGRKLVLHIGGADSTLYGRYRGKEWYAVRASFDAGLKPDIDLNTYKLGELPKAAFDAVWCSDTIEHLSREQSIRLMRATYPLVKKGGEWSVTVPDMETLGSYLANRRGGDPVMQMPDGSKRSALQLAFGKDGKPHLQGFTPDAMAQLLLEAGIGQASITARALFLWVGSVIGSDASRKIRIRRNAQATTPPAPPPVAKQPHPGQFYARMLPDELDIPPTIISTSA